MRRWELWDKDWDSHEGGGSSSFFPEENEQARKMALDLGESLVWETTAKGYNDALREMYVFRGWGEYKPVLREDGSPFPGDEDDDFHEV
jgi:hypothetical protein